MKILDNWIFLSIFAAVVFALGDFAVVLSSQQVDIRILYLAFIICIGVISAVFIFAFHKDLFVKIKELPFKTWGLMLLFCVVYFFGYLSHLKAIQVAPNPGYSNALVMFHIVLLTILSYKYLGKPVNTKSIYGMGIMFLGAYILTMNSEQSILHSNI